jgi:hypothetical protein
MMLAHLCYASQQISDCSPLAERGSPQGDLLNRDGGIAVASGRHQLHLRTDTEATAMPFGYVP